MKPYRGTLLACAVFLAALPLSSCVDTQNGGSGSYLRVQSITPLNFEPDLFRTLCSTTVDTTGVVTAVYETNNVKNHYASVSILNGSAPTTPTGESTSSFVTLNNYRVHFTGVSRGVSIPDIFEGGQTVGIAAGTSASMTVVVMDLNTIDYIRSHYRSIGNGESLTLRATITIWGEDSFNVKVSAEAQVTLVVDDYTTCP